MTDKKASKTNILDLTCAKTLFELAVEKEELLGGFGSKLIADLRERAVDAEYTHMYFRDPFRPGMIWFIPLNVQEGLSLPIRGKLDECRKTTDAVFPKFLKQIEKRLKDNGEDGDEIILSQIPPLATHASALDLVTALEYLVFVYPAMTRAWAALMFTYDQIMGIKEGSERVRAECMNVCAHAHIVAHLTGDQTIEA